MSINTVSKLLEDAGRFCAGFHDAKVRNIARESAVMTDTATWYRNMNKECGFTSHDSVNHRADEYARYEGEKVISTNTDLVSRSPDSRRRQHAKKSSVNT